MVPFPPPIQTSSAPSLGLGIWLMGHSHYKMRKWWLSRRVDGWMDGWMDRWMVRWMDGWTVKWMDGQMDNKIVGWMDDEMVEEMVEGIDEWKGFRKTS